MFLTILIVIIFLLESIYYIYFINTHKQETIEYFRDIPSNENPAIVGLMVKGNVDGNDIVATILDLWKKDYINVEYRIINGEQKCIGYKTDDRSLDFTGTDNLFIEGCMNFKITHNLEELKKELESIK